jgi:xanthine dehydrogenase YagR molybdenum-binding subunit
MKFDTPATTNPIDQLKVIGQPTERIEGPLKTCGQATYAYEQHEAAANQAYGVMVDAAIAKGRIKAIHLDEAKAAPGVLAIVTAANAGKLDKGQYNAAHLLAGPEVQHYQQAVALVVAETFEQARAAAQRVKVDYEAVEGKFDLASVKDLGVEPKDELPDVNHGDFDKAFAAAPVQFDQTYTTPDQSHAMMEPHATLAAWKGDQLTLWTSNQMVAWSVGDIAKTLGLPKEKVRLVSPYIGGGFGGKLFIRADAILAALGARMAGRPVKVALARPQMANNTTHRPATIQRIRMGATADGKLTAIAHEGWSGNLADGKVELAAQPSQLLYAAENRRVSMRLAPLDLPEGNAMRAPGEAPGLMVLEIAMDEMAEQLKMDPVQFRILNDTQVDPVKTERPFSQRQLIKCLQTGAEKFGWNQRKAQPASRREGRWLIGMGVAAAFRNNLLVKSGARVHLERDGKIVVETDMTDIGTGSYTIIAQTAAEMMGVSLDAVVVRLGDSNFPVSAGSGGQFGGNCSTSGVYAACVKLREAVAGKLGMAADQAEFVDGQVRLGNKSVPLRNAAEGGALVGEDSIEFGDLAEKYQQSTFGAHFVEVAVDAATGEVRVRRMLAVCAAGRILNPTSARSQVIGAMTMGVGAALMEELVVDKKLGFFVNHDLAGYEVPVHADIPHQEVIFLDETGICGVSAAVANAIYNATGARVREYPITLDKILSSLPEMI